MADAKRDENRIPTALGVSSVDGVTTLPFQINPTTGRLLTDVAGGAGGTEIYVTVGDASTDFPVADYADIGAAINAAYASLPSTGGTVFMQNGTYSYTTPIVFGTNGKIASLIGSSAAGTILYFTSTSGNAITINHGDTSGRHRQHEVAHFSMRNAANFVYVGTVNTRTSVGLFLGGANGCPGINVHDMTINGFGTQIEIGQACYMAAYTALSLSGGNGVAGTGTGLQGSLVHINSYSNSGERLVFSDCTFSDPCNAIADNAIYVETSGSASLIFKGCSLDNVQLRVLDTVLTVVENCHIENPTSASYGRYVPVYADAAGSGLLVFSYNKIQDGASVVGQNFDNIVRHGTNLVAVGNQFTNANGLTHSRMFDCTVSTANESEYITGTVVQGSGVTEIARNWANSGPNGMAAMRNYRNSWPSGIVVNADNTVNWKVGSNVNAITANATGDLTIPTTMSVGTGLVPDANDGAYLGTTVLGWSDLFLASGAVINFDNGNAVLTHSAGILTVTTGDLRVTTAGTNTASVVTVGGTQTLTGKTLTSPVINTGTVGTSLVPTANDGATLGNVTNQFSDLFLASGGVINWNNGNITLTHSASKLTLAGGDLTITATETPLLVTNTTDTASVEGLSIEGDRATPTANDEVYMTFRLSDSVGTQTSFARIVTVATTVTDASETADLKFQTISSGSLASRALLNATAFRPNANDGIALGTATVSFSDLFLAEGGVINWDNGDATLTQVGNDVTLAGASLTARVKPRTGTTTSSATPTINTDNVDFYSLTAQTVDITSFTTNLSGTPTEGQKLHIAITGTAARAITWGASFEASTIALPTTTVTTARLDVGFVWNTVTSKWRCIAVA